MHDPVHAGKANSDSNVQWMWSRHQVFRTARNCPSSKTGRRMSARCSVQMTAVSLTDGWNTGLPHHGSARHILSAVGRAWKRDGAAALAQATMDEWAFRATARE